MIAAAAAAGVLRSADLLDVPNVALLRELRPARRSLPSGIATWRASARFAPRPRIPCRTQLGVTCDDHMQS
jgi:hypothetical protein